MASLRLLLGLQNYSQCSNGFLSSIYITHILCYILRSYNDTDDYELNSTQQYNPLVFRCFLDLINCVILLAEILAQ